MSDRFPFQALAAFAEQRMAGKVCTCSGDHPERYKGASIERVVDDIKRCAVHGVIYTLMAKAAGWFPVLLGYRWEEFSDCPLAVPWALIEPYEAQARRNHSQSLKRLAERGGLSPLELYDVVVGGVNWFSEPVKPSRAEAVAWLKEWVNSAGPGG